MRTYSTTAAQRQSASVFPHCELHGVRIVDFLPPGCPYRSEWPSDVLACLQDDAWRRLSQGDVSGLDLKARYEICSCCRLSREVRERLRRAEARPPTPPRRAPSTGPVAVHLIRGRA
jgi:hypothetical protein